MQSGSLVGGDVLELSSRIVVSGIERKFVDWSIDREIDGDLPEAVVAGSGIKQATGRITWAEGPDLSGYAPNPWNSNAGWLPSPGEIVAIYVSDGATEWLQFVGVIDDNDGDVGERPTSTIVDYIDFLNRPVSHSTVLRIHPPKSEGGGYLYVGMSAGYAVDRAMRACGFYATPPMEPGVVWSVPGQMSMWPEYGNITAAASYDGVAAHAENWRAPWGLAVGNFNCTYTPQGSAIAPSDPVQITAMVSLLHGGVVAVSAMYGSQNVQLHIDGTRTARGKLNGTTICTLALGTSATKVTLQAKAGTWTLRTDAGATATGSATIPSGSNLTQVIITGDPDTVAAGMQISKPPAGSEFRAVTSGYTTYFQHLAQFASWMDVLPSYVRRPAIDLLTEISKANLVAMWFNELGEFQFIGSDVLRDQDPVQTITTLDDIRKLSWKDSRLGMRSRVRVKYQLPVINRSKWSNVLLWQGSGETMESGQEKSLIAEAPDGEHWAEIDHGAASTGLAAFNAGRGTWTGGYVEASDGSWSSGTSAATWDGIRTIDERTRVFGVTVGSLPAGSTYVLSTPDDAANYFQRFRGFDLPVLRGRAKVVYTDAAVTSAITGPSGFPELEHDSGPWAARAEPDVTLVQDRMADFIAEQVTVPAPTIGGMDVGYDPRRQLGDVITITSELMGISLNALIVGISNRCGDSFRQTLKVRIISATSSFTTYGEFEAAHPDTLTYEQWRLLYPDTATYSTFNSDPLRGGSA